MGICGSVEPVGNEVGSCGGDAVAVVGPCPLPEGDRVLGAVVAVGMVPPGAVDPPDPPEVSCPQAATPSNARPSVTAAAAAVQARLVPWVRMEVIMPV